MALAIGVGRGHIVYIDDVPLEVLSCGTNTVTIKYKEVITEVDTVSKKEIASNVKVFCSVRDNGIRLCFEAPITVRILREKLYKERSNGRKIY